MRPDTWPNTEQQVEGGGSLSKQKEQAEGECLVCDHCVMREGEGVQVSGKSRYFLCFDLC